MTAPRIAIATLWDGNPDYSCAVLPWCQHARQLATLLGNAELLVLLTAETAAPVLAARATLSSDCPAARVYTPEARLRRAVQAFARRGFCRDPRSERTDRLAESARNFVRVAPLPMMFKWWVASLIQYKLVVFADLDVQLLRREQPLASIAARWVAGWSEVVPPGGSPRVLGSPDSQSPFNAGLWTLANPSTALYEAGINQLRTVRFNRSHGFGLLGSPRNLVRERPYLFASLHPTRAWKRDVWSDAGLPFMDCDQGFLYFVFYLLFGIGRQAGQQLHSASGWECQQLEHQLSRAASVHTTGMGVNFSSRVQSKGGCPHTARHHYGPLKPWRMVRNMSKVRQQGMTKEALLNGGRIAQFLDELPWGLDDLVNTSRCARKLASWRDWLPKAAPRGTRLVGHGKYHRLGP